MLHIDQHWGTLVDRNDVFLPKPLKELDLPELKTQYPCLWAHPKYVVRRRAGLLLR